MANLNLVQLIGNLTRDPELKFTPQGTAVCKFSLAINRKYKGNDGEMKQEVEYVNVVVWGKTAENVSKYLTKGKPCYVQGRLQTRSWETPEKQKRYATEVVAEMVQFLGTGSGGGQGGSKPDQSKPDPEPDFGSDDNVPY